MPPAMTTAGATKENILTFHHCKKKRKEKKVHLGGYTVEDISTVDSP